MTTQLNLKAPLSDPQLSGYTYFNYSGTTAFTEFGSQYLGAIGTNISTGQAKMGFVNCGKYFTNATKYAFGWYLKTSATTQDSLMVLQNRVIWKCQER